MTGPLRRVLTATTGLLVAVVLLALAFWAGRVTLPATPAASPAPPVWASAATTSVGRSVPVAVTVRRPVSAVAQNSLAGVVTERHPGETGQGSVLYVVGATPVRVVRADKPFWRDLTPGTRGEDVRALQQALADLGLLSGAANGRYDDRTREAVAAWQRQLGAEATGSVPLGELMAVRTLPATLGLGESISIGKSLSGGEDAVLAPAGDLEFWLLLSAEQTSMIPRDADVHITFGDRTWSALMRESRANQNGGTDYALASPNGGAVCADACGQLPPDTEQTLLGRAVIVPSITGIGVPAAAVHSRPDGTTYVITPDGEVDVRVTTSSQGVVIVEGLAEGTQVQVSAGGASPSPTETP